MTPQLFIAKWKAVQLSERSAAQQHFLDLCLLVGHEPPAKFDPVGEKFTFEKGATKNANGEAVGEGWADVWKRGFFAWEYKGKHKDLVKAYGQLQQYRESLENPPLLVVCDLDRIVVRTNFTATPTKTHEIPLEKLGDPRNLEILRNVFHDPEKLRPGATSESITKDAAERLAYIAENLRGRGHDPLLVAKFLDRVVFCLFAEDVDLLPKEFFRRLVEKSGRDPARFAKLTGQLFEAMANGGDFGMDVIRHFNGRLFDDTPVIELLPGEMDNILAAARLDWSAVDPSIFGTLFERGLNPDKRSQLGAHYTSRADIETLVDPVIVQPLRREWEEVKQKIAALQAAPQKAPAKRSSAKRAGGKAAVERDPVALLIDFHERLNQIVVLDPACGSGNFLYVSLQRLLDLEKEVILFAAEHLDTGLFLRCGPHNVRGIELDPYAFELAQVTTWIGYLQWRLANGYGELSDPILEALDNFENKDAILDLSDPENPQERKWAQADFIVGNPPFLGSSDLRSSGISDAYVTALNRIYGLPGKSDLCCYWFEKSRRQCLASSRLRVGLLATQTIRHGASSEVLKRINVAPGIFFGISNARWFDSGAAIRISMFGFGDRRTSDIIVDGQRKTSVNFDLSEGKDTSNAPRLAANLNRSFEGDQKGGPFEMECADAVAMALLPNPHGRPNSDVLRPRANAERLIKFRIAFDWVVDFGDSATREAASLYETPYSFLEKAYAATAIPGHPTVTGIRFSRDVGRRKVVKLGVSTRPGPDKR